MSIVKDLVRIANELDDMGLYKQADQLDNITKKIAGIGDMVEGAKDLVADKLDKLVSKVMGTASFRNADKNQLLEMLDLMNKLESAADDTSLVWSVRIKKAQDLQHIVENILNHPSAKKILDPMYLNQIESILPRMEKKIKELKASLADYRKKQKDSQRQTDMTSAFDKIKAFDKLEE